MPSRPLLLSLALMLVTIAAGLTVRFAPLGLPLFVVKYGGSTLWALMVYWIISALLPSWRLLPVALLAGTLATAAVATVAFQPLPAFDLPYGGYPFGSKLPDSPRNSFRPALWVLHDRALTRSRETSGRSIDSGANPSQKCCDAW
jgi:hypothetical protein